MNKGDPKAKPQDTRVSINLDTTPILYTDNVNISVNSAGVVLNIMQRVGSGKQMRIVSRTGMSREHAKQFVKKLGELLALSEGQTETGDKGRN